MPREHWIFVAAISYLCSNMGSKNRLWKEPQLYSPLPSSAMPIHVAEDNPYRVDWSHKAQVPRVRSDFTAKQG